MNQKHQPVATAAAQALFAIVTFVTGVETPQTQQIHYFLEKYKTARERCFPVWCSTKKKKNTGTGGFSYSQGFKPLQDSQRKKQRSISKIQHVGKRRKHHFPFPLSNEKKNKKLRQFCKPYTSTPYFCSPQFNCNILYIRTKKTKRTNCKQFEAL